MGGDKAIAEYAAVAKWGAGLRTQWGGDPLAEEPEKLDALEAFCAHAGKDPDALVAYCFLRKKATGERFASEKRRAALLEQIREYVVEQGLTGIPGRRWQSAILSFLIHNGVYIQAV